MTPMRRTAAAALLALALPVTARAQGAPGPAATAVATPPDAPPRPPADDPQADRGVLLPTAYTHPKGTFFFTDYDLVIGQIGYAVTDDTQVSLTGLPPLGPEPISVFDVTLKSSLYRGELVRVAALGSTSGLYTTDTGVLGIGRVGGVAQLCFDTRCGSSVSMSSNITLVGALLMVNGISGIYRVNDTISFLGEVDTLIPLGNLVNGLGGAMAGGGVRFKGTSWGLDLSLMRVVRKGGAALPIIALTYRAPP
jgi:hypothetical protein